MQGLASCTRPTLHTTHCHAIRKIVASVHSIIGSIGLVHEACKDHGFQYEPGRVIPCYNVLEGKLECNKQLPTNRSSSKSVKCNQPRDKNTSTGNSDLINSV